MTAETAWYAEYVGFLVMLGIPLAITSVVLRRQHARERRAEQPRLALRPDDTGALDDVVVRDVDMFRAELMDDDSLWMCCYLPGTGDGQDRVTFWVRAVGRNARLEFSVTEFPSGDVTYEPGSMTSERGAA